LNDLHITKIARELSIEPGQVRASTALLADGATVPFVARYRKEATGSLDEVAIAAIRDRLAQRALAWSTLVSSPIALSKTPTTS
jgi:uncharacterized protein